MLDLVSAVAAVLEHEDDSTARASAALVRLTDPDVRNDFHEAIHAAVLSARAAYVARDDVYENPSNSRVAAEIATSAVMQRLMAAVAERKTPLAVNIDEAQRIASTAEYRDWRFRAVPMADGGVGIEVEATNADTYHPDRTFTTTRVAEVTSTVEDACFRAALLVEYHEAQERFRVGGKRVFDSHSADNVPPPTNVREHTVTGRTWEQSEG